MSATKHTPGPLVARRINDDAKPFAVINPNGKHGDEIVGGFMSEADAILYAAAPDMLEALKDIRRQPGYGHMAQRRAAMAIAKAEGRA